MECEISRVTKYLDKLKTTLNVKKLELLKLRQTLSSGMGDPPECCTPRSPTKDAMRNGRTPYVKHIPKYRPHNKGMSLKVTNWYNPLACMTKLINLSKISSSSNNQDVDEQVLFDSGANCCVTNRRDDFVGAYHRSKHRSMVDGIGKGLQIEGKGKVAWTFIADNGSYRTLLLPCYYIPTSNTRIASISEILRAYPKESITIQNNTLKISGYKKLPSITVDYCSVSNLPFGSTQVIQGRKAQRMVNQLAATKPVAYKGQKSNKDRTTPSGNHSSLTQPSNINLSEPEKELLRWHYRLGHIGMKRIQWLLRQGILATSERQRHLHAAASKLVSGPLCTACQYAKQRRKTSPGATKTPIRLEANAMKRNELFPGSEISIDHFICNPPGHLLTS